MAERSKERFLIASLFGFIAGFLATPVFHEPVVALLGALGVAPYGGFLMEATRPFGVPAVISLSFWGGVWGILFALVDHRFPRKFGYWVAAFLFGAVVASIVALVVVLPMKGRPMGGGWHAPLLLTAFLSNGAWGIGTAVFLKVLRAWRGTKGKK